MGAPAAAEAQVFFGGQVSLTNLGTDQAEIGETLGVGARIGTVVWQNDNAHVAVEGVADAFFPPCDDISCDLFGGQLNVLAVLENSSMSRVYGGVGPIWQTYTLEDDGLAADGSSWGLSLIVGGSLIASETVEPFFEVRLSAMGELRNQASGIFGFRIVTGRGYY